MLYQPLARSCDASPSSGIRTRIVKPEETDVWAAVTLQGWSEHLEVAGYLKSLEPVIAAREGGVSFLAELDGRPIAAGALCLGEGVALLAGACTIPEARGRGAQRALLEARLGYAAGHGCDVAMVVAEPGSGSQRNAERHGFRVAYTRTKWILRKPPQERKTDSP